MCGRLFRTLRALRTHKGRHSIGWAWTGEELEILREKYPTHGSEIEELLSRHSKESIRSMARLLGIRLSGKKPFSYRLKTAISRREKASELPADPYFWAWLAGFIDGDGSFKVAFKKKKASPVGFEAIPSIELFQGVAKRREMEEIASKLGKPLLIEVTRGSYMVPNEHPVCRLVIHRLEDLLIIARNVYPHLRIKKHEGELFLKILTMIERGDHLTKDGILEIAKIREGLVNGRRRPRSFKSFEVIKNEVSGNVV
jgi:hypothetical protein